MSYWASLPGDVLAQGAPVLVAALGGLLAEAAGALNIALEGLLALGSFAYAWATPSMGQGLGFLAALLSGTAFAALLALVAFRLKADLFVVGLAGNIIAQGGLALAAWRVFGTKGVAAFPGLLSERLDLRGLADFPLLAQFIAQRGSTFLLLLASLVLWALYAASPFGLRVRAAGQKEESLALAGVDPRRVRLMAFAVSGAAAALAGAALSAQTGAYVPGASAGRGWIALVAIYLGRQKPAGTALAVLAFAILAALSNALQALTFPPELALALPYAVTALIVLTGRVRLRGRRHGDGEAA